MSEKKPIAWVTYGDAEFHKVGEMPPNWNSITTSEETARYWVKECRLRVLPLYAGEPIEDVSQFE